MSPTRRHGAGTHRCRFGQWLDDLSGRDYGRGADIAPEYREAGLANLYSQLVDEVANARLAADAGRADSLDERENVATAMKLAADRVLAEAYITDKVSAQLGEEAIQAA